MTKAQYYGKLIFSLGLGRHSKFDLSGGFGYLQDRFYPTKNIDYSAISQDEANYKLGQLKISYDFNTLDNQIYPSTEPGFLWRQQVCLEIWNSTAT